MKSRVGSIFHKLCSVFAPGRGGSSLRVRLYIFLSLFVILIMVALVLVLYFSGVFSFGTHECRVFLETELAHISNVIEEDYGTLSVEGVSLSQKLGEQVELTLSGKGISATEIQEHPEHIEAVLNGLINPLTASLEKNKVSAVYFILDATVNPAAENADNSRAGLFIRNMEPNAVSSTRASIHYMRGPISIARERKLWVLPQWTMEFSVEEADFFHLTMQNAGRNTDISRQYYWNQRAILADDYEESMLFCVPVVTADGTALGVCGFEVSAMLFKLQYAPDNRVHKHAFTLLAPINGNKLDIDGALTASNFSSLQNLSGEMSISEGRGGLANFSDSEGSIYSGLWREIRLYPKGAALGDRTWAVAAMIPEKDLDNFSMEKSYVIIILLGGLLVLSVVAAVFVSRRYLAPVYKAFDKVKSQGLSDLEKTNILEIDDLFAFLSEQEQPPSPLISETESSAPVSAITEEYDVISARFESFLEKLETLTRAERAVFNLYAQGRTAQEITETLILSINTIKTHNRKIYMKLDVTSRKEMMVYVNMLKEKGCLLDDK